MNMQEIQPKLEYLQKKYKSNPEKMNEEVMKLYKEYNVNPMSGCLPLLIQMPILIGLFAALRQYDFVNAAHATFFWIPNLGDKDPFYILPVLVALTMFVQQKISMGSNEAVHHAGYDVVCLLEHAVRFMFVLGIFQYFKYCSAVFPE